MTQSQAPDISVVIPAYNEEARLERTLRSALHYFRNRKVIAEIIVVDDGSRDRTSSVVRALESQFPELRLIRLARNQGKGYAVRTGVMNATGRLVLFADADGATPIAEVERLEAAIDSGALIAIGSRAIHTTNNRVIARRHRRIIGRTFHLLVTLLCVRGIEDTQCGFKLFRSNVAHDLFSRMRVSGFSFDVEVLLLAQYRGYGIVEVAVNWTHQPGSRVNLVVDSLRMAADLLVIRSCALKGSYRSPHVRPAPAMELPFSITRWALADSFAVASGEIATMGNHPEPADSHRTSAGLIP